MSQPETTAQHYRDYNRRVEAQITDAMAGRIFMYGMGAGMILDAMLQWLI